MSKKLIFISILMLAFVLRFYKLGQVPASLNWDENSNGYNAYSILKTAKDEYGNFMPLTNRSFNDYKPPLYMYATVPSVAIFGLTPFAVRLPSAIFGFLTIPLFFLLVHWLAFRMQAKNAENVSLIATLFLAISPWHLQFSRVGFEATLGLFMVVTTMVAFLYGLKKWQMFLASSLLLGISFYSYHAQRIFLPLLVAATGYIFREDLLKFPKKVLAAFVIIFALAIAPLLIFLPKEAIFQRLQSSSGSLQQKNTEQSAMLKLEDTGRFGSKITAIHSKKVILLISYFGNYISHFDPNFLFSKGDDNFRHHIENMGMFYLFEIPLILYGLYFFMKNRSKTSAFILSWIVLSPIPAIPVAPAPHAIRSFQLVIPMIFLSSYSLSCLIYNHKKATNLLASIVLAIITISFLVYTHNYYVHYNSDKADQWQYGYSEAAIASDKLKDDYDRVIISSNLEQAYIFWLFATKFDPKTYQQSGSPAHFDKFYFGQEALQVPGELLVTTPPKPDEIAPSFPKNYKVAAEIKYPDGSTAVKLGHP